MSRTTKMALTHSTILSHPRGLNFLLLVKTGQKSDETLGYLQNTALTAGFVCNCLVRCLFVKPVLLPSQVQRRQAGKPNCIKCRLRFHLPAAKLPYFCLNSYIQPLNRPLISFVWRYEPAWCLIGMSGVWNKALFIQTKCIY